MMAAHTTLKVLQTDKLSEDGQIFYNHIRIH